MGEDKITTEPEEPMSANRNCMSNNKRSKTLKIVVGVLVLVCVLIGVVVAVVVTRSSDESGSSTSSNTLSNDMQITDDNENQATTSPSEETFSLRASASPSGLMPKSSTTAPSSGPPSSLSETQQSLETPEPTVSFNTESPTRSETEEPTESPSSEVPTLSVSESPSRFETKAPMTARPTKVRLTDYTVDFVVEPNPVPQDNTTAEALSFFNYDSSSQDYGPDSWPTVDTSDDPFWVEFDEDRGFGPWRGHLSDPTKNRCGRVGKQSPIDLYQSKNESVVCAATHQIRSRSGTFRLSNEKITKRIESNKLRLELNRRACRNLNSDKCREDNPPIVDYPNYSSGTTHFSDLINFDIKVPGEHWLEGESFDAEIQLMHSHLVDSRVTSIGIPIRATEDGFNAEFQDILDEFDLIYRYDQAICAASVLGRRRAASKFYSDLFGTDGGTGSSSSTSTTTGTTDNENWGDQGYSTQLDDPEFIRRLQQRPPRFNPYTKAFLTTLFFFRYNGSTTEPPCFLITWFVMSLPMLISFEQLRQIKFLLFTHVNGDCEKTSVHNSDQSVARPLQPLGDDRDVIKCVEGDFEGDPETGF